MSKTSVGLLIAAVLLIAAAVLFEVPFMEGGAGLILLVALGYAYVVTERESKAAAGQE